LIATADVVIENFSPRVLDGFGITWDLVHDRNHRAVMVRMPAFGLDGPWRDRTGFAQTMEQVSGMAWLSGFADGLPVIPRGACDPLAGMHAVVALLGALFERDRSGDGCLVEVPMVEAALNVAAELVIEHSAYGASLSRAGNAGPVASPQGLFACRDAEQWLALAAVTDDHRRVLRELVGEQSLEGFFATRDLDDAVAELVEAGVPAAPVLGPVAVLDLPPLRERGFVERINGPIVGEHECLGLPFQFESRTGPWFERPAPVLGADNREVLRDLGVSDDRIDELIATGIVGGRPGD
jgi:crotonobetainyl-CoA:carnitine CoA-transferase CaiB-like acyl-CoA transferase